MLRVAPVEREVVEVRHQVNQAGIVERRLDHDRWHLCKVLEFWEVGDFRRRLLNHRDLRLIILCLELSFGCVADFVLALRGALLAIIFHALPFRSDGCQMSKGKRLLSCLSYRFVPPWISNFKNVSCKSKFDANAPYRCGMPETEKSPMLNMPTIKMIWFIFNGASDEVYNFLETETSFDNFPSPAEMFNSWNSRFATIRHFDIARNFKFTAASNRLLAARLKWFKNGSSMALGSVTKKIRKLEKKDDTRFE